jgi:hypothetical protein
MRARRIAGSAWLAASHAQHALFGFHEFTRPRLARMSREARSTGERALPNRSQSAVGSYQRIGEMAFGIFSRRHTTERMRIRP